MDKPNYYVEKILLEIKRDNFSSLPIAAQERVLHEIESTINYVIAFKDSISENSYEDLLKDLKKKYFELKTICHIRQQKSLQGYD